MPPIPDRILARAGARKAPENSRWPRVPRTHGNPQPMQGLFPLFPLGGTGLALRIPDSVVLRIIPARVAANRRPVHRPANRVNRRVSGVFGHRSMIVACRPSPSWRTYSDSPSLWQRETPPSAGRAQTPSRVVPLFFKGGTIKPPCHLPVHGLKYVLIAVLGVSRSRSPDSGKGDRAAVRPFVHGLSMQRSRKTCDRQSNAGRAACPACGRCP